MKNFIIVLCVLTSVESLASLNVVKVWRGHKARNVLERDRKSDGAGYIKDCLQNHLSKDLCTIVYSYAGDWYSKDISQKGWISGPHYSIVTSLSAGRIVTGNVKGGLNIVDLNTERSLCKRSFGIDASALSFPSPITAIVADGGQNMHLGHYGGTITLYDVQDYREKSRFLVGSLTLNCLLFYAPNMIISGSGSDDSIYCYRDQRLIHRERASATGYGTRSLATVSNSEFISTSDEGCIRQWLLTPSNIRMMRSMRVRSDDRLSQPCWYKGTSWKGILLGDKVVIVSHFGTFSICDMRSGAVSCFPGIIGYPSGMRDLVVYGDMLISCSPGDGGRVKGLVEMHDVRRGGEALSSIKLPGSSTASLAIDRASKTLVAVSDENIIKIQL
jgi:hypothetical protein